MKFSPDSLLQIYLDGSFTEEAQAEFDRLVRKDPGFAERVTQAVAERVGPVPEASLNVIGSKLDARMASVWQKYKPSPLRQALKLAGSVAALGLGLTGFYFGGTHLWSTFHGNLFPGTIEGQNAADQGLNSSAPDVSQASAQSSLSSKPSFSPVTTHKTSALTVRSIPASVPSAHGVGTLGLSPKTLSKGTAEIAPSSNSAASSGMGVDHSVPGLNGALRSSSAAGVTRSALPDQDQIAPPSLSQPAAAPGLANGTQEGNALKVSIETQKTEKVVVNVLDSNGLLIRHLYQGSWEAGNHQVDWDGKDDPGNPVLPGDYTVTVNADGKTMSGVVTVQPNK